MDLVPSLDLRGKRVLIFIVAYNAETTIEKVLGRIPASLHQKNVEVLIIDDASRDETFRNGLRYQQAHSAFKITVLRTPENQGYGGNQKLGYRYAIDNNFDIVALLHGDGQYAPEKLPALLAPLIAGEADAVFGSRMIDKAGRARRRNAALQVVRQPDSDRLPKPDARHPALRVPLRLSALLDRRRWREIPFEKNTNDFHFDTEIIIQFVLKNLRIVELPIPTYYGDEICHVNGLKYAWDVCLTMLRVPSAANESALRPEVRRRTSPEETYDLKLGFESSHTARDPGRATGRRSARRRLRPGSRRAELARKGCRVTGMDHYVPTKICDA